jgi:hypothetical protein
MVCDVLTRARIESKIAFLRRAANISAVRSESGLLRRSPCFSVPALLFLEVVFCIPASGGAQVPAGSIRGRVTNKTSIAAIENAEIVLVSAEDGRVLQTESDSFGRFYLLGLTTGTYELRIHKDGYAGYRIPSVPVLNGCENVVLVHLEERPSGQQTTLTLAWDGNASNEWSSDRGGRFDRARMESVPAARNIWALLQNQDVSSVSDHLDEGGFQTGVIALVGVHGGTWTQNAYRLDGLNITNPYEPGKPLAYPDPESLQELRASGANHSAAIAAAGADFQMTSRRGGRQLHGGVQAAYLGNPLQSSNLDDRLRGFGYEMTPHFRRSSEGGITLGGALPWTGKWSFFSSLGVQHLSRIIPDFAGSPTTGVYSGLLRLDGSLNAKDQLSMLVSGQIAQSSNLGARPGVEPSSSLHGNDRFEQVQGHWTHRASERSLWGLNLGFSHASPTDTLQAGITRASYTQLFTGEMTGAAPLESDSALSRFSIAGQLQTLQNTAGNWHHLFDFGIGLEESLATEEQRVFEGLNVYFFPANVPSMVEEFNSPSHAKQRLREFSLFVEDRLNLADRVFVRLGANLDASNASLPRQVSGAGPYAPAREFAGAKSVIAWTTLSPRLGLTIPFRSRAGTTRLTVGYARYYHLLPSAYADYANPTSLGGSLFRWNDRNHDGTFQPGEEGALLRVFGGAYDSVDPNLRRPFTDEWGLGLEHDLGRRVQLSLGALQRDTRRLIHTVNLGVPFSAFAPVIVFDPGGDNIPGTGDDHAISVYNQDPRTLGQDRYLLTNPSGLNARYRGLESNVTARLAERGFFSVSFAAYKSEGDGNSGNSVMENDVGVIGNLYNDPNTLVNSRGRLFFDRAYVAKIAAYFPLPLGLHLGSAISYFDGLPFGRRLVIADFNQGPFAVMATPRGEPDGFRTQYVLNFDQRVSRQFALGGTARMALFVDIFNLLNTNKNLSELDLSGPLFSKRRPTDVQNPRVLRVGISLKF